MSSKASDFQACLSWFCICWAAGTRDLMFTWLLEARGTEATTPQWVESCETPREVQDPVPGGECFPEKGKQETDGLPQEKEHRMLL